MLLREDLCRSHERRIITGLHRQENRSGGDEGLSGSDIPLQET